MPKKLRSSILWAPVVVLLLAGPLPAHDDQADTESAALSDRSDLPVDDATMRGAPPSAASAQRIVRLAQPISPAELHQLLMDLPGTFQLVDIRPPDQFTDYHLPSCENVDLSELVSNPAYLTGAGPLVIVDRDGSLAMMLAGIVSQKTERPIKALFGGLQAYWNEVGIGASARSVGAETAGAGSAPSKAVPVGGAVAPAHGNKPKKRRSAGC